MILPSTTVGGIFIPMVLFLKHDMLSKYFILLYSSKEKNEFCSLFDQEQPLHFTLFFFSEPNLTAHVVKLTNSQFFHPCQKHKNDQRSVLL